MKKIAVFVLAATLACLMASCAANSTNHPSPTGSMKPTRSEMPPLPTAATPSPSAKLSAQTLAETKEELERAIRDNLRFDVEALLPQEEDGDMFNIHLSNQSENRWMLVIRDEVGGAIAEAIEKAEINLAVGLDVKFINQITAPSWQYLYMLLRMVGDNTSQYGSFIAKSLSVETSAQCDSGWMSITVRVAPVYYRDAILSFSGDKDAYLSAEFAYTYMMTVFDENIAEKEYVQPPAQHSLAEGIAWPLGQFTRLRKTWYAARDAGERKHTGTDIWAPEGAEIYSCTDGTVFYVGCSLGGGNTVVVMDDYGYMFYYHHMVRLTDFLEEGQRVKEGELIGHVGNTGNSSRDHLHLTIAGPDGILINPYPYLLDAMPD